jgi:hypothetical protein
LDANFGYRSFVFGRERMSDFGGVTLVARGCELRQFQASLLAKAGSTAAFAIRTYLVAMVLSALRPQTGA